VAHAGAVVGRTRKRGGPARVRRSEFCEGVENRTRIRCGAACPLHFDRAKGCPVAESDRGLAAMRPMMNVARMQVAMRGLGRAQEAMRPAGRCAAERVRVPLRRGRVPRRDAELRCLAA
jgi:alkylation response protein AidB-like acyl-CoA dehydrogenase